MNQPIKNKTQNLIEFWNTISTPSPADAPFISAGKTFTYSELAQDIRKTTTLLKSKNVLENDSVLLITSHAYQTPQLFLGCLFNGVNSVILDTEIKPDFLEAVIRQNQPKLIFCDPEKFPGENFQGVPIIRLRKD